MLWRRLTAASVSISLATLATVWFPSAHYNDSDGSETSVFCYVKDMSNKTGYHVVPDALSPESVADFMSWGQPFVVTSVSNDWPATRLWSHAYFQHMFKDHDLFSSTFSTTKLPQFDDDYPNKAIYYGIFLNSQTLAAMVASDYEYPFFIPHQLRLQGNEWIHWGQPPCGAKRHVDLTCTGRVSVQVRGSKMWRLYPPISSHPDWAQVLVPQEVVLGPGDALVWFPGWEHETRIETGPSVSLSLHFSMNYIPCHYTAMFSDVLSQIIGITCDWSSAQTNTNINSL